MVALSHPVTSRVLANLLAFVSEQDLDLEEEEVVDTLIQVDLRPTQVCQMHIVQADFLGMREVVEECAE